MRRASFILTLSGIGSLIGIALAISLLLPYRTRFQPSPPAVHTLNVWGQSIHQEPASVLIAWINQEVPRAKVGGAMHEYRLKPVLIENQGSLQVHWYMRTKGTSPAARSALGPGIANYFKQVNLLLASRSLRIENGYLSDSPRTNQVDDTIDWEQPLWIRPVR